MEVIRRPALAVAPRSTKSCLFSHLAPGGMASFVRCDYEILREEFAVRRWFYRGFARGLPDRVAFSVAIRVTDFSFCWFAYTQAYWAIRYSKAAGKKSIVVLGGFDVCEEEDPRLRTRLDELQYILRNADQLLAISERVKRGALTWAPEAEIQVVPLGFDPAEFPLGEAKSPLVTTVAFIRRENLERKGLEVFTRAATLLPNLRFEIIGKPLDDSVEYLRSIAPRNLKFTGPLSQRDLVDHLQRSAVYVQASTHEGFGAALAEAMLCGCAPVVSHRGAIPEVVGESGVYVDEHSAQDVANGIERAITQSGLGTRARGRIMHRFPREARARALISSAHDLLGS